jgi:hypothetical protein
MPNSACSRLTSKSINWLSDPGGRGASASASRRDRPVSTSIKIVAGWRSPEAASTGERENKLSASTTAAPDKHRMTSSLNWGGV